MNIILHISLESSAYNQTTIVHAFDRDFKIIRYGTDGDFNLLKKILLQYDKKVACIALSGLPNPIKIRGKTLQHDYIAEIYKLKIVTPIVDGQRLRELYIPWVMQNMRKTNAKFFDYKKIAFFSAAIQYNFLDSFISKNSELIMADPMFYFNLPLLLSSKSDLEKFILCSQSILKTSTINHTLGPRFTKNPLSAVLLKKFFSADIFFSNLTQLSFVDRKTLMGKTLVIDAIPSALAQELLKSGVTRIISFEPKVNNHYYSFTLLEAMMVMMKGSSEKLEFDDIKYFIDQYKLAPKLNIYEVKNVPSIRKFAFLIHPLQVDDLLKVCNLSLLKKLPYFATSLENIASKISGFHYGTITGIKSKATQNIIEGDLYMIAKTPKQLLKEDPEKFYDHVKLITQKAKEKGALIFGLGAYTKIVGDAGISIAERSPIPVTTGNSLSACATIWAANYTIGKMGLIKMVDGIFQGKVLIIGATGSIGKVLAKVLAPKWAEIILVAPKGYKLMEIAKEVHQLSPQTKVIVHTENDKFLPDVDLIISTTSSTQEDIININNVKPGAVICDVSRPFNISETAALKRPDVLVIASGEVELPGSVVIDRSIGLHGNIVYACLAETAILALEGKFESFSISRDLDYKKVSLIDLLARKHGVKLAAIMGHRYEITLEEILLCKERALEKLGLSTILNSETNAVFRSNATDVSTNITNQQNMLTKINPYKPIKIKSANKKINNLKKKTIYQRKVNANNQSDALNTSR